MPATIEQLRELFVLVKVQGITKVEAYYQVFPGRRGVKRQTASKYAGRMIDQYIRDHEGDMIEVAARHNVTPDRVLSKINVLLDAETPKEVVYSKLVEPEPEGMQFKPFVVTMRNTELFLDGGTQLGAVREAEKILGMVPPENGGNGSAGTHFHGDVYLVATHGEIRKKPQRGAERDVSPDTIEGPRDPVQGS